MAPNASICWCSEHVNVPSRQRRLLPGYGYNQTIMEKVISRYPLKAQPRDTEYWLSRPVAERLAAVEQLRQNWLVANPDAIQGLQRVCRIAKRTRG
jgi:hypothetical protein